MKTADSEAPQIGLSISSAIDQYFSNLDGAPANNIYAMVVQQVEKTLLESIMNYAQGNQSKAAIWLGISRNTLRKLLAKYKIS